MLDIGLFGITLLALCAVLIAALGVILCWRLAGERVVKALLRGSLALSLLKRSWTHLKLLPAEIINCLAHWRLSSLMDGYM